MTGELARICAPRRHLPDLPCLCPGCSIDRLAEAGYALVLTSPETKPAEWRQYLPTFVRDPWRVGFLKV